MDESSSVDEGVEQSSELSEDEEDEEDEEGDRQDIFGFFFNFRFKLIDFFLAIKPA